MAAGVPVIAMDLGSPGEIIIDNKVGFLVNSTDQAVEAINKTKNINPHDCRQHVEQNFSIEQMVCGYEKVYEKIFQLEAEKN